MYGQPRKARKRKQEVCLLEYKFIKQETLGEDQHERAQCGVGALIYKKF